MQDSHVQVQGHRDDLPDLKARKAQWETMKSIASAVVVASGLNWADDDMLRALVLDESD